MENILISVMIITNITQYFYPSLSSVQKELYSVDMYMKQFVLHLNLNSIIRVFHVNLINLHMMLHIDSLGKV